MNNKNTMAKISKYNLVTGGKTFVQGQVYEDSEIKGLDQNDFEDVVTSTKEATPKAKKIVKAKEALE
jgi:hypothetical protein